MLDLIKKTLLAGIGAAVITKDKLESALEDMVRQGKVNAADAKIMAEKIAEQGRKEFDELAGELNAKLKGALDRRDTDTAERLQAIEQRLALLEQKLAEPPSRNGEP
jgi:polyhydroxyalkanoate synthesis regulator phasin